MNITAGTVIDARHEVRLFRRKIILGNYPDLNDLRHAVTGQFPQLRCDWNDFGRGCQAVRLLMLAGVLTAADSGAMPDRDTGVIGWNGSGCTAENLKFWQDYVQNGREHGRGGLFVATLPTIPCCEAAIALGCHGPGAYFRTKRSTTELFRLLTGRPQGTYLIGEITGDSVCMLKLETDGKLPALPDFPDLEQLFRHLEKNA